MTDFLIRPGLPADHVFVFDSWVKSHFEYSGAGRACPKKAYLAGQHRLIEAILARGRLDVAHPEGDEGTILGYLVSEGERVGHYCYVKESFRRYGVARALFAAARLPTAFVYSHQTVDLVRILKSVKNDATFDPYAALAL